MQLSDYSENEIKLFKALGMEHQLKASTKDDYITPVTMYRTAMEKAFINDMRGPAVESLRRCMFHLRKTDILRRTEDWDNLIIL